MLVCFLQLNTLASSGLMLEFSSLHMFFHGNIFAGDCAKELFKPSKDSASLRGCNETIFFGLGFHFVSDIISGVVLGLLAHFI